MAKSIRISELHCYFNSDDNDAKYVIGQDGVINIIERDAFFVVLFENDLRRIIYFRSLLVCDLKTEEFDDGVTVETDGGETNVVSLDEARKTKPKREF